MIRKIDASEIAECVSVIRKSFATVAKEFGITETNCPSHTSFIKAEKLQMQYDNGQLMFACTDNLKIVGYFSLASKGDGNYELDNLSVLPEYRHKGYGKEMIIFAVKKARDLGGGKISIGIIEENTQLKNWYCNFGFKHTGTRKFEQLPFTVGFMEIELV